MTGTVPIEFVQPSNIDLKMLGGMGQPLPLAIVGTDNFDFYGALGTQLTNLSSTVDQVTVDVRNLETYAQDNIGAIYNRLTDVELTTANTSAELEQETTLRVEADYALATRIDNLTVTAGQNTASIQEEQTIRAAQNLATAQQITTLNARVDSANTAIETEQTVRATAVTALAEEITNISAQVGTNRANIEEEIQARVDADSAMASQITAISTRITGVEASVTETSEAISDLVDGASAAWGVWLQARLDGTLVQTGIQLGAAIGVDGTTVSKIALAADLIEFYDSNNVDGNVTAPFYFDTVGGTAYLNAAVIKDATITNTKIGAYIRSTAYNTTLGQYVWNLDKASGFSLYPETGYGGIRMTSQVIKVYDEANTLRVQLGNLSV